jgi:hypothetical protein
MPIRREARFLVTFCGAGQKVTRYSRAAACGKSLFIK